MSKRRKIHMATQLAPTPTVYGKEAERILEAVKKVPSEKAKKNGQKLVDFYSRLERKGNN